jgi:hypothetical protein
LFNLQYLDINNEISRNLQMSQSHDKAHYHIDPQDFYKDAHEEETGFEQNKQNIDQQNQGEKNKRIK